jgi:hypothetical protein
MSEARERGLTAVERVALRIHLLMFSGCRNFGKQMHFLSAATQVYVPGENGDGNDGNSGATPAPPDTDLRTGG